MTSELVGSLVAAFAAELSLAPQGCLAGRVAHGGEVGCRRAPWI